MRILLVEDEPIAAKMLAKGLREETYAVDVAKDGEEALARAQVNTYDLIILDVMLPRKDGFAVCRKLWEQVPETYRAAHCYTDFWEAYQNFIPENQQTPCCIDSGMKGSGSGVIMNLKHSLRA